MSRTRNRGGAVRWSRPDRTTALVADEAYELAGREYRAAVAEVETELARFGLTRQMARKFGRFRWDPNPAKDAR